MGCARAAVVVIGTWLALLVLLMMMASVLPDSLTHGVFWSTAIMLWLLALLLGPLVACLALRRWIATGRAGRPGELPPPGPYPRVEQDMWQYGGPTWHGNASPPPWPGDPRISETPPAPEASDAEARRRAAAEAERERLRRVGGYLQSRKGPPPH